VRCELPQCSASVRMCLGGVGPDRGLRGGGRRGWCEEWDVCKSIPTKLLRLSSAALVFYSSVCPAWIPARLALAHVNHIVSPLPEEILPLMASTFSPEVVLRFEDRVDFFMLPKLSHQSIA